MKLWTLVIKKEEVMGTFWDKQQREQVERFHRHQESVRLALLSHGVEADLAEGQLGRTTWRVKAGEPRTLPPWARWDEDAKLLTVSGQPE